MSYERNWQFYTTDTYVATTAILFTQYQLWSLKAMLKGELGGFTQGLWTCYGSSDGSTAGTSDLVDRWGATFDASKLVRSAVGATAKSWIVLKSPTMGGVVWYLTLSFEGSTDAAVITTISKTAPTGGTVNVHPTSADEWLIGAATVWNAGTAGLVQHSCMSLTTAGDFVWYSITGGAGFAQVGLVVVNPVGCHASDQYPVFTYLYRSTAAPGVFTNTQLNNVSTGQPSKTALGVAAGIGLMTAIGSMGNVGSGADILTGKMPTLPAYVLVNAIAGGTFNFRGRLPDIYVIPQGSSATVTGYTLRDTDDAITHVSIGQLFIPSNAVPLLG